MKKSLLAFVMTMSAAAIMTIIFGLLISILIMLLWNFVMPDMFGLPCIGFWQSYALFFLIQLFRISIRFNNK